MSGARFRSVRHALRWYLHNAPKASSVPSIDGVNLTRTATLNGSGDVVEEFFVQTPRVDGGCGSINEDRLCGVADIEACLPDDYEDRLLLLVRAVYSVRKSVVVLNQLTASKWYNRRIYSRYDALLHDVLSKMQARSLVPRSLGTQAGVRTVRPHRQA